MYAVLLKAAGIPFDFEGAIRYDLNEVDKLLAAIFATMTLGSSVRDDFFVVPDGGRQFLQTDHHEVIHVSFADEQAVAPFVDYMPRNKYALPAKEPDSTFKRPGWMK